MSRGATLAQALDPRPVWRAGIAVIAVALLAVGAWVVLAPLAGAVIAPGFVKVDLNRKVVQHLEGGTIRAIRVRDGDRVAQGQELVLLDDVRIDAQLDLLRTQLDGERAKAARLEAERAYAAQPAFPKDIAARKEDAKVVEILSRETTLFRARRDALESQVALLRRQIRETVDEVAALTSQLDAEERALKLQKEELAANQRLLDTGYVQKTRVLTLQRAVAEYEAKYGEHRAELAKARQRAGELELRILSMRNAYAQTAADELKEATAKIFDLEDRIRPSRDASERQRIAAPIAGEVVGLKVFTAGSVIGPRDVLMEIVPDEKRLIVEARIRPEDINHVRAGSAADVRLTAFQQRTTPLVAGSVSYVSGDRLVDPQTGAAYYAVQVIVAPESLAAASLRLQAGMPAEVFIRTDERSALDYLLAPVTGYLRRAMREPL
jgi:HlyD family type I secretion membrane fusion protein